MGRRFKQSDRKLLYIVADGKCERCGAPIDMSFHADHKVPFSKGGPTIRSNAQALCPKCNLEKGDDMIDLPPWNKKLRNWQTEAFQRFQANEKRDFLLVATPGAGKTTAAIRMAHHLFVRGAISRLVIVTPTTSLKKHWAIDAKEAGINIDYKFDTVEKPGMHGVAMTYSKVAAMGNAELQSMRADRRSTLVILDEIHHVGENYSWGIACQEAFNGASYRLCLSGTPFRTDECRITFVTYKDEFCCPDYTYSYENAVTDGVCREVYFPTFNGIVEYERNGVRTTQTLDTRMDEEGGALRLRMVLDPNGDWIKEVLTRANEELTNTRETQPNAGGLVIAMNQDHAKKIKTALEDIIRVPVILSISEDLDSDDYIESFKNSTQPWIVAVRKVSEGVDIKRLRVLVYATNYTSRLFFRQAVGRVIRKQPEYVDQMAYVYIPEDPELVELARQIKSERLNAVKTLDEELDRPIREQVDRILTDQEKPVLITSTAMPGQEIFDSRSIEQHQIEQIRQIARNKGIPLEQLDRYGMWMFIQMMGDFLNPGPQSQSQTMELQSDRYAKHKNRINRKVNELARLRKITDPDTNHWRDINYLMNLQQRKKSIDECDEAEFLERYKWLCELIEIEEGKLRGRTNIS